MAQAQEEPGQVQDSTKAATGETPLVETATGIMSPVVAAPALHATLVLVAHGRQEEPQIV